MKDVSRLTYQFYINPTNLLKVGINLTHVAGMSMTHANINSFIVFFFTSSSSSVLFFFSPSDSRAYINFFHVKKKKKKKEKKEKRHFRRVGWSKICSILRAAKLGGCPGLFHNDALIDIDQVVPEAGAKWCEPLWIPLRLSVLRLGQNVNQTTTVVLFPPPPPSPPSECFYAKPKRSLFGPVSLLFRHTIGIFFLLLNPFMFFWSLSFFVCGFFS